MEMTTIEAIEILTEVQAMDDSMYAYNPKYNEALEMAINVLKIQEQDERRYYEASVELAEYCKRYEPTYDSETGAM